MTDSLVRSLYKHQSELGQGSKPVPPVTYGREFFAGSDYFADRCEWLVLLGVDVPVGPLLVVGAGFGFLVEELLVSGRKTYGIEPGEFFWDHMATESRVENRMINDWVGSSSYVASLRRLAPFGFVIDEDAAPSHSDSELPAFFAALEAVCSSNVLPATYAYGQGRRGPSARVVHIVSTLDVARGPGDSSQNWKTQREWKQLAPDHIWLDASDGSLF